MKKIVFFLALFTALFVGDVSFAAFNGIIPSAEPGNGSGVVYDSFSCDDPEERAKMDLGSKIKWGCLSLSDIPLVIVNLIDLLTQLAGTIAVLMFLYGGVQLMVSGVTDDREAAKNTIKYALFGLILSFSAWIIVNVIQSILTS